ncbi:SMI1/KNR4 family protein [Seohaeicola saemankumensis]|nr:SMI1/KNR4 family protein [Seohaeicola saemankumensis]MCA0870711.1 SMI1/KNR4 family protein [Seohaeicola saemankumensis]
MRLKEAFPNGRFVEPASRETIRQTEAKLGVTLPEALVALYLETDGFREPLGNAKYLLSLEKEDKIGSLISTTRFWWNEWPDLMPDAPDLRPYVFFGSSSSDEAWGIRCEAPHNIIAYHHSMGSEFEEVGRDIVQLYLDDIQTYED